MSTIFRATESDFRAILDIGRVAVEEAHRLSCTAEQLHAYLQEHYNAEAIKAELRDTANVYHILRYGTEAVGFSKIIPDADHAGLPAKPATKLDRIYLLKEYHDKKLGLQLLEHLIQLSRSNNQKGIWLFTWTGNERAINFYKKTGFTIIGTHQFKVTDTHYNPNHHMWLEL